MFVCMYIYISASICGATVLALVFISIAANLIEDAYLSDFVRHTSDTTQNTAILLF